MRPGHDLVPPTGIKFTLLDSEVARQLGVVAAHLIDEPLGILAPHERLDGVAERVVGARAEVEDGVDEHPRLPTSDRDHLLGEGVLVEEGESLRFVHDHLFNSPSTAAGVVLGRNANGRLEWTDEQGRTLRDIAAATVSGG